MASAKYKLNSRGYYETKVWDGTYTSTGAKHRKTLTSKKSSADLEKKVNAYRRQLEENDVAEINITFGEYSRRWFDVYKQTKELNTKKMYKTCVDKYLSPLDEIRLVDLKHSHFQQIINENSDYPKTCKNIKLTFTQIVRSAVRDHYLPHNALDDITMDI
nr:site-specific integrase [Lachnospiraceae bacterium]